MVRKTQPDCDGSVLACRRSRAASQKTLFVLFLQHSWFLYEVEDAEAAIQGSRHAWHLGVEGGGGVGG